MTSLLYYLYVLSIQIRQSPVPPAPKGQQEIDGLLQKESLGLFPGGCGELPLHEDPQGAKATGVERKMLLTDPYKKLCSVQDPVES